MSVFVADPTRPVCVCIYNAAGAFVDVRMATAGRDGLVLQPGEQCRRAPDGGVDLAAPPALESLQEIAWADELEGPAGGL